MVCGFNKTTVLTDNGQLYVWGVSNTEQIGHYGPCLRPVRLLVVGDTRFVMISSGFKHYAALAEDGTVWTWGKGRYGVLGHCDGADRSTPTRLNKNAFGGSEAVMVACGWNHTMVVTVDGRLWTFGRGREGQVGHGNTDHVLVPRNVCAFDEVKIAMVAGGRYHSIAATAEGDVFTWGWGQYGELGHNEEDEFDEKLSPAMLDRALFRGSRVLFVAAGENNSAVVTEEGLLFVWGYGLYGQLGLGDNENKMIPMCMGKEAFNGTRVLMVSCSTYRSLAVTEEGGLWSWGRGSEGSLGHNDELDRLIPTRVDPQYFDGAKIVTAAAGSHVLTAVTEDGALYSWGKARDPFRYRYAGLGHSDTLMPTRVDPEYMQGARVGRCHRLLPQHALAFAMGLHSRLGTGVDTGLGSSLVSILDDSLVEIVVGLCRGCPAGVSVELDGVMRLMGGCLK